MAILSPSILSANYMNMQFELDNLKMAGVKWVHVDIMDGQFVPNMAFGWSYVSALRKTTSLILDVHLMIDRPIRYVEKFCNAGADYISIHVESDTMINTKNALKMIRKLGVRPGIVVKPNTPAEAVFPFLNLVDMVLVMTVEPGLTGQKFMPQMMHKVKQIRAQLDKICSKAYLEVDGGVDLSNYKTCKENGADVLVSGSGFFLSQDKKKFTDQVQR